MVGRSRTFFVAPSRVFDRLSDLDSPPTSPAKAQPRWPSPILRLATRRSPSLHRQPASPHLAETGPEHGPCRGMQPMTHRGDVPTATWSPIGPVDGLDQTRRNQRLRSFIAPAARTEKREVGTAPQPFLIDAIFDRTARMLLLDAGAVHQCWKVLGELDMQQGGHRPPLVPMIGVGSVDPATSGRGVRTE